VTPDREVQALAREAAECIRRADLEGLAAAIRVAEEELLVEGLRSDLERAGAAGFSRNRPSPADGRKGRADAA
jgi:hypothetical protein